MLPGDALRRIAGEVDRSMEQADPDRNEDVSALLVEQIGFAAGWVSSLRGFSLMPGSARRALEEADQALERAAQIVAQNTDRPSGAP